MNSKLVEKPWGNFKQYISNEKCTVKIITVKPNQKLSLQSHERRDEIWVVLDNELEIVISSKTFRPKPGDQFFIPKKTKHRLSSLGKEGRVLEISLGEFDEEDITRYEDVYGRSTVQ